MTEFSGTVPGIQGVFIQCLYFLYTYNKNKMTFNGVLNDMVSTRYKATDKGRGGTRDCLPTPRC